jgi:hypothetical protein
MKAHLLKAAGLMSVIGTLTSCNSVGGVPSAGPNATPAPQVLASAENTLCVPAQSTPQTVRLPVTAGVTATLNLSKYDAGSSGCQNITIATGSAASIPIVATPAPGTVAASSGMRAMQASNAPLLSITLGQGLNSSLGLTSIVSGITLNTGSNLVFPNGTYNATINYSVAGQVFTISLVFTAVNGQLTVTNGSALPLLLSSGAVVQVFPQGVVPPGFTLSTPSPAPTVTTIASAAPTMVPSVNSAAVGNPPPPEGTPIGSQGYDYSGTCPVGGLNGYQCTVTGQPILSRGGLDIRLANVPGGLGGTTTYNITGFIAASYQMIGCPSPISYSGNGPSGTFTYPDISMYPAGINAYCAINLSSAPPNYQGSYYSIKLVLFDGNESAAAVQAPMVAGTPHP